MSTLTCFIDQNLIKNGDAAEETGCLTVSLCFDTCFFKNLAVREENEENKELNKTVDALRGRIIGLISYIVILTTCQDHKVKWSLKWAVDLCCVQLLPHSATKQKNPLYLEVRNRTCVLVESVVYCISSFCITLLG